MLSPAKMRLGFAGSGSLSRFASISRSQYGAISPSEGRRANRVSTTEAAIVQRSSPGSTIHVAVVAAEGVVGEGVVGKGFVVGGVVVDGEVVDREVVEGVVEVVRVVEVAVVADVVVVVVGVAGVLSGVPSGRLRAGSLERSGDAASADLGCVTAGLRGIRRGGASDVGVLA